MRYSCALILLLLILSATVEAQSIIDGFVPEKGGLVIAVSYNHEKYDEFYAGENKVVLAEGPGLNNVITQSVNLYAEYGLSDKIGLVINLPYISAKADPVGGGTSPDESGLQNAAVALEWKLAENEGEAGKLSVIGALALNVPLSDYATNVIYAIGNHATSVDPRLVLQYMASSGFFVNAQAAYSFRTNDVPNAVAVSAKAGLAATHFYIDAYIAQQWSTGGIDIGSQGFAPERFPETQVNTTNIGVSAYVPIVSAFGITAGAGTRVAGRNAGLPFYYSFGLALNL